MFTFPSVYSLTNAAIYLRKNNEYAHREIEGNEERTEEQKSETDRDDAIHENERE